MAAQARGAEVGTGPRPMLSVADAVSVIVGVVVGIGIFRSPSLVAANTGSLALLALAWVLGGLVSLAGALCYAELGAAYPHAGGDYHYLSRAFGRGVAFLFGWARMTVIQTGSIAAAAFVFGDYVCAIAGATSAWAAAASAAGAVALFTALNAVGVQHGRWTQNVLSGAKLLGGVLVIGGGLLLARRTGALEVAEPARQGAFGLAMVFVLYTYGGWNEAAYISAEIRDVRRNMLRSLLAGTALITCLYLLANAAYVRALGVPGVASSDAVAADTMRAALGDSGSVAVSVLVALAALGVTNACVLTGARTTYAFGRDTRLFWPLGQWHQALGTPVAALVAQGAISLVLVLFGLLTRKGFETLVAYTAPVFWLFFLLAGVSLIVLRGREPDTDRPFRVPLYPLVPLAFCAACAYMLHASVAYAGIGALAGLAVLALGGVALLLSRCSGGAGLSGSPTS